MVKLFYVIALLGVVASCSFFNNQYTNELKNLDAQLEDHPEMVWDSLKKMDTEKFNESQLAYYYLLNASASDKNLVYLDNDSTLSIALEYYRDKKNDLYNLARAQYYMGKYEQKKERYREAYEHYKEAEINFKDSKEENQHLLGLIYFQIALIQKFQNNLSEAEISSQKSFEIFTAIDDTISAVYALKQKGVIEIKLKKYSEAKDNLYKSLDIISNTKKESKQIFEVHYSILGSISQLYRRSGNIALAADFNNKVLSLFKKYNKDITSSHYQNTMVIHNALNNRDSTRIYCHKMIEAAEKENNVINLFNGYRILSLFEAQDGNYKKACELNYAYNKLKDSWNEAQKKNNLLDIEKRYSKAESERQLYKAEISKLKAYFSIPILVLIGIIIGIFLYNRHKKLKVEYNRLSEMVKHSEWGFLVTKEFITENHIAYDEMERMLNREKGLKNINVEIYNKFHDALIKQKTNYSGRLLDRLTNFDGNFGSKFQRLFPDVNAEDFLMTAMIHHKWKISDMTVIFHVSVDALRKRKTRLTHKISAILNKEIDLDEYLTNL